MRDRCRHVGLSVATAPAIEPLTLDDARTHLRIDHNTLDSKLIRLIRVARQHAESMTGRALITQTIDVTYNRFCTHITIPRGNLQSITSVKYQDQDDTEQTLDSSVYRVDTALDPGRIQLDYGQSWPDLYPVDATITIRAVVGYGAAAEDVPEEIKEAMLLMVGHWLNNEEASIMGVSLQPIPMGAEMLLDQYRLRC